MTNLPNRLLPRPPENFDVLSDVLRRVRLTGAMLFLVEATTPWITQAPEAGAFSQVILPGTQHLISYHVVVEGSCWGGLEGEPLQRMEPGDILVVAHGAPYRLANPADTLPGYGDVDAVTFFRRMAAGELPATVSEGGGGADTARFICGFLGCDVRPFNPVLAALPPVLHLRGATQAGGRIGHLVEFAVAELREARSGSQAVLLRLSELMFIAAVRHHLGTISAGEAGWLAGLRDPLVANVLTLLHGQPARDWTLKRLAGEAGASRSVLVDRFTQVVGQAPMRYLAAWRMQLATHLLAESGTKVQAVAEAVGYESEAAFSRAFTRMVGTNPVVWRNASLQGSSPRGQH